MTLKSALILSAKVLALTITLLICFSVAALVSGLSSSPATPDARDSSVDAGVSPLMVFLVFLFPTAVLTRIVLRSRWFGWKLMVALFLGFYGVNTVLAQIESVIFLPKMLPAGTIDRLFIMGAMAAGVFIPLAVLLLGRVRKRPGSPDTDQPSRLPLKEMLLKLVGVSLIYMLLYFSFGYFIAWKNPVIQDFYGAKDAGSFFAQLEWIWRNTPWMFPLQVFRGLLFGLFLLPTIRMLKGSSMEIGLTIGVWLIAWSGQLLLPNPYMPASVAKVHLLESVPYHFVFGWLMGWLFSRHHASASDLLRGSVTRSDVA
jgi:hypothetical protein